MSEELVRAIRAGGPVSPAVQFRMLLQFGRERDWSFESAWKWSFERVRFPHDTVHRREWKKIVGEHHNDPRSLPTQQRAIWKSAYERTDQSSREQAVGVLAVA